MRITPTGVPRVAAEKTLGRRVMLVVIGVVAVVGVLLAVAVPRVAIRLAEERASATLGEVVGNAVLLVDRSLADDRATLSLLGSSPYVLDAVRAGAAIARRERLADRSINELEQQFNATRSLDVSDRLRNYFRNELPSLGAAEIIITEASGLNVIATSKPSDFVQRDEEWWRLAQDTSTRAADVDFDESTGRSVIVHAAPVRDNSAANSRAEGVIKAGFEAASLQAALQTLTPQATAIELVDKSGRVVLSTSGGASDSTRRDTQALNRLTNQRYGSLRWRGMEALVSVRVANHGEWRAVAIMPRRAALASLRSTWLLVGAAAVVVVLLLIMAAWFTNRFFARRVTRPASELARVAEAVAAGNLSVQFAPSEADDEIGRLSRAMSRMLHDLREATNAVRGAAAATTSTANQITSGTNGMAAATVQIAHTASTLSSDSMTMQQDIRSTVAEGMKLRHIAADLASGARGSAERVAQLQSQAEANRQRFEDTELAIGAMSADVEASATATRAVEQAANQLAEFVALVTKIAKQSKLLALNASLEAVRAGEEARGFATVAHEVRRLARSAQEGSERADLVVEQVRSVLRDASGASTRAVERLEQVAGAARLGRKSLEDVGRSLVDAESWVQTVDRTAEQAARFVDELTGQLQALSARTEQYVAALQEVAASTQDQSAGAEQIATAANALLQESADLSAVVERFVIERAAA
jgi:methyl-accepting chemotaxis protein